MLAWRPDSAVLVFEKSLSLSSQGGDLGVEVPGVWEGWEDE